MWILQKIRKTNLDLHHSLLDLVRYSFHTGCTAKRMGASLIPDDLEANQTHRRFQIAGMPLSAIAFLVLTAAVSLVTSHYRFIHGDDLLDLWVDRASSFAQLVHIQRDLPLAIDPFFYHGLMFLGIRLFGVSTVVLQLPALLGFLLMQICLFRFVRRVASERAAVFALAFPAISGAFGFTVQIRPYGLLLGLFGLAMLSWQTAVRRKTHRDWPLVALALTIALAINTHYYSVLLLLPLCAAELVRACQNRRLDLPMLLSMAAGMAGAVFLLPFLKGASEFRANYQAGAVPYQLITQSYNYILLGHGAFSTHTNHLLAIGLALLIVLVLGSCVRQMRSKTLNLPHAEFVFLVSLAALPFAGFLLARFVTHAMEPRYVLGSIIGIAALLAIALVPILRNNTIGRIALFLLCIAFVCKGIVGIRAEQRARQDALSYLILSPEVKAAIMASPSKLLYLQDIDLFGFMEYYEPDADVRSHMALVYSRHQEIRWNHSDASSLTALHLKSFTTYTILPYESLATQPGEHIFVVEQGGWNWIEQAFAAEHVELKYVGKLGGNEVVSVRFPNSGPLHDPISRQHGTGSLTAPLLH